MKLLEAGGCRSSYVSWRVASWLWLASRPERTDNCEAVDHQKRSATLRFRTVLQHQNRKQGDCYILSGRRGSKNNHSLQLLCPDRIGSRRH